MFTESPTVMGQVDDRKSRNLGEQSRLKNTGGLSRSPEAILSPSRLLFLFHKSLCRSAGGDTTGVAQNVLSRGRKITTYMCSSSSLSKRLRDHTADNLTPAGEASTQRWFR